MVLSGFREWIVVDAEMLHPTPLSGNDLLSQIWECCQEMASSSQLLQGPLEQPEGYNLPRRPHPPTDCAGRTMVWSSRPKGYNSENHSNSLWGRLRSELWLVLSVWGGHWVSLRKKSKSLRQLRPFPSRRAFQEPQSDTGSCRQMWHQCGERRNWECPA